MGTTEQTISSSGWTDSGYGALFANDAYDAMARVSYKTLGAGETSVSFNTATGGTVAYASCVSAILIFRDAGSPNFTQGDTAINGLEPTFNGHTSLSLGTIMIDWVIGAHTAGAVDYSSSSYDTFITVSQNDTRDASLGIGIKTNTGVDFTGDMTPPRVNTADSHCRGQIDIF